jgi:alcohol dehydrogenase, propanol-preferring
MCHTDIHAANGDCPIKPSAPFIPGHEGVGIVTELAPGEGAVGGRTHKGSVGDRVAMPWLGYARACCNYCVSGWETLCHEQEMMGYTINGGFGGYAVAYARYVVKLPDGIDSLDAAPVTCAGVTTYKAVKVAGTRSSISSPCSASAVWDTCPFSPRRSPAGGVDQAIALAVSPRTFEQAYSSLRRGGRLVFVALPADNEIKLPIFETVLKGSQSWTRSLARARTYARCSSCTRPARPP